MSGDVTERLVRLEEKTDRLMEGMSRMTDLLMRLVGDVSEIKGRIADVPTARDFGELKGRVEEISRHQGVTLSYQPPEARRAAGPT